MPKTKIPKRPKPRRLLERLAPFVPIPHVTAHISSTNLGWVITDDSTTDVIAYFTHKRDADAYLAWRNR